MRDIPRRRVLSQQGNLFVITVSGSRELETGKARNESDFAVNEGRETDVRSPTHSPVTTSQNGRRTSLECRCGEMHALPPTVTNDRWSRFLWLHEHTNIVDVSYAPACGLFHTGLAK